MKPRSKSFVDYSDHLERAAALEAVYSDISMIFRRRLVNEAAIRRALVLPIVCDLFSTTCVATSSITRAKTGAPSWLNSLCSGSFKFPYQVC
ncbi:hypothetical protein TNCV_3710611 [Trichonephila clavipes]|nr:hypothetical protein TNCV_3710611 [Trichonephila clavipes]